MKFHIMDSSSSPIPFCISAASISSPFLLLESDRRRKSLGSREFFPIHHFSNMTNTQRRMNYEYFTGGRDDSGYVSNVCTRAQRPHHFSIWAKGSPSRCDPGGSQHDWENSERYMDLKTSVCTRQTRSSLDAYHTKTLLCSFASHYSN